MCSLSFVAALSLGCSSIASQSSHAGVEPISKDEEEVLESDSEESGRDDVMPNDDAVARLVAEEEAMMEMTEDGPYQAIL